MAVAVPGAGITTTLPAIGSVGNDNYRVAGGAASRPVQRLAAAHPATTIFNGPDQEAIPRAAKSLLLGVTVGGKQGYARWLTFLAPSVWAGRRDNTSPRAAAAGPSPGQVAMENARRVP